MTQAAVTENEPILRPGWQWATIGDIAAYVSRGRAPKYTDQDGVAVINQKCIRWHGIEWEHIKYTTRESVDRLAPEQILRDGDVLWNSTGTGTIGRAAVFHISNEFQRVVVDTHVTIVRPLAYNSSLLQYWIFSDAIQKRMDRLQTGSTNQVELSRARVLETSIPVPPFAEQNRIVAKLDELFSQIEKGEENLKRVQALVKQYRQSVLKAAVTGELTRDWRETHGGQGESGAELLQRILAARRAAWEAAELEKMKAKGKTPKDDKWKQKYKEAEPPDIIELPKLPEGWVWATLEQLVSVFRNGLSKKPYDEPPGVPIFRISAVRSLSVDGMDFRYYRSEDRDSLDGFYVRQGDLLFTRYNGSADLVGVCGVYRGERKTLHPDKLIRGVLVDQNLVLPSFLEICFAAGASRRFVKSQIKTTAGQHGIAGGDLKRAPLPLPPLPEQIEIVSTVEAHISNADAAKHQIGSQLSAGDRLRQSVLRAAFSGKLIPQETADEPASLLLERVDKERVAHESANPKRGRHKRQSRSVDQGILI